MKQILIPIFVIGLASACSDTESSSNNSTTDSAASLDTSTSADSAAPADTSVAVDTTPAEDTSVAVDTNVAQDTAPPGPAWSEVHSKIIAPSCGGGYCHGGGNNPFKVTGDASTDYQALLNGQAGGKKADKCTSKAYIVPGAPEQSLIWLKSDKNANHGCGNKMPPVSKGLSQQMSDLLKDWIAAGAKE
ncbi:MAG: hypothetical protein CMH53_09810 [Myxococcales bacterium]|nr:hypothetical protein [Myxococcales bacterium]